MSEIWIAAVASVGGAYLSSQGAKSAGNAAAAGSEQAIAEQRRQFDLMRSDTAPYRQMGVNALGMLGGIYGFPSTPAPTNAFGQLGGGSAGSGGGSLYAPSVAGTDAMNPWSASGFTGTTMDEARASGDIFRLASNPTGAIGSSLGVKSDSTLGKILDPSSLFGGGHGDEKRNMKAFLAENPGILDAGGGQLMLPDGMLIPADRLEELAGTWYGARYAPDGDQAGWQQKLHALQTELGAGQEHLLGAQDGSGRWMTTPEQAGFAPMPGGGVDPRMTVGGTSTAGTPAAPDYSAFFKSPDYQFRKDQGMQGIERSAAARGGLGSGNTLTALADYNSNLAAGEYGNFYNRLASLAGIGQTAVGQSTAAGANTANAIGGSLTAAADARASGIGDSANAWGNAFGQLGGIAYDRWGRPSSGSSRYGGPSGWIG